MQNNRSDIKIWTIGPGVWGENTTHREEEKLKIRQ